MNDAAVLVLIALLSYLVGAVPFGFLVARWRGVDIFQAGSGNIGATNVGRVLGKRFGLLVFALDFLKGALPTLAATLVSRERSSDIPADVFGVAAGLCAFLGHLFPIYLRFRGGKGVATGAGVVCVLVPLPTIGALLTWVVAVSATRYVSLASLLAGFALCLLRLLSTPAPFSTENVVLSSFCLAATILVFVRHSSNIRRLLDGTENRMKDSTTMFTLSKTLHVLALGMWFGMGVFFSFVVAFGLFGTFEKETLKPQKERPLWLPLPDEFAKEPPSKRFPDPLSKEQGSRAAGFAIAPLFDSYFILQAVCGAIALITALGWSTGQFPGRIHKVRSVLLVLAVLGVAVGWWLEKKVSELGVPRIEKTDIVLKTAQPTDEQIEDAEKARATFGMWHGIGATLNLLVILLVTAATALAAQLPVSPPSQSASRD
jgi:acyl phosphate:glycerol-3-phosphate acyltransferase